MRSLPGSVLSRSLAAASAIALAACGTQPERLPAPDPEAPSTRPQEPGRPTARTPSRKPQVVLKKGGGFYKDDGPGDDIPDNLDDVPDAEPKWEPIHRPATKPYVVLGKAYVPNAALQPYRATGIASWYGKKFHGQKTSIGEPYDMFAMTAAHTTLAIPSYVRVTSIQNGKSVIVRVTDRGPFHADRIIDLSYAAAWKLGLINNGSGQVEVEAIVPDETGAIYARTPPQPAPRGDDELDLLARRLTLEEGSAPVAKITALGPSGDVAATGGIYLQLGAFSSADNAENLKNHLSRELDWLGESMRIIVSSGIHRVHLGPYANRSEAGKVAEKIRLALGFKPTVVTR